MSRIREILRRIRILGSLHWITDLDPDLDPALFVSGFQDATKKNFNVFCLLLSVGTLHLHQSSKKIRSHTTVEIKFFLNFFAYRWKDPNPGGPKTYGSGTLIASLNDQEYK